MRLPAPAIPKWWHRAFRSVPAPVPLQHPRPRAQTLHVLIRMSRAGREPRAPGGWGALLRLALSLLVLFTTTEARRGGLQVRRFPRLAVPARGFRSDS